MMGEMVSGVLLSRDLFFASKITGTAAALGVTIAVTGSPQAVPELVSPAGCRCLFLDLADGAVDPAALLGQLPPGRELAVVAFGSHVQVDRLQAARAAGCTAVLPRSQFSATLPELIRQYCLPGS